MTGLILRKNRKLASKYLISLLSDSDAEIRGSAIRALSEAPVIGNDLPLAQLILDSSPKVRALASIAAGRLGADKYIPQVCEMIKQNADQDPVLRHAGVMALMGMCKSSEALLELAKSDNDSVRLAVVLVLRRQNDNHIAQFVQDKSTQVADEAIRAIVDLSIDSARPAVASLLDHYSEREWTSFMLRRLVHNAYRVGGADNAQRLVNISLDKKLPAEVRIEALRLMTLWTNPYPVDQLTAHWNPMATRPVSEVFTVLNNSLLNLLDGDSDTIKVTLDLVTLYKLNTDSLPDEHLEENFSRFKIIRSN
jgi:quinoprotein glucose dehydrogenase